MKKTFFRVISLFGWTHWMYIFAGIPLEGNTFAKAGKKLKLVCLFFYDFLVSQVSQVSRDFS